MEFACAIRSASFVPGCCAAKRTGSDSKQNDRNKTIAAELMAERSRIPEAELFQESGIKDSKPDAEKLDQPRAGHLLSERVMIFRNLWQRRTVLGLTGILVATAALIPFAVGGDEPAKKSSPATKPPAYFTDVAKEAGLTMMNVFGGVDTKKYIIETTGTGVAIFDYDNDGWPDIFIVNGTTLDGPSGDKAPTNHLYRNNHDGTFTDVTVKAGLVATGWGQGVCIGDYDNDGWEDLYVTYYGKNLLYHNN